MPQDGAQDGADDARAVPVGIDGDLPEAAAPAGDDESDPEPAADDAVAQDLKALTEDPPASPWWIEQGEGATEPASEPAVPAPPASAGGAPSSVPPPPPPPPTPAPPPAPATPPTPATTPTREPATPPAPAATPSRLGTVAAFTDDRMLRPTATPPSSGWRRVVHQVTGGRLTPAPSQAELAQRELIARVTTPIHGARTIAVISRKGGVGKTTTTLMLGHTFATHRGDRVVALDGNPDAGSLGYRVKRETDATVTDLLDDAHRISRYADLRSYTTQTATRLEVVASDDDPHITQAIGRNEYRNAVEVLERHYNLIMLDTGTGILDSATQGILRCADQLVVVTAPSLDGARAAGLTLDWLDQHGFGTLASQAVAVLNANRRGGLVEVDKLEEHFAQRCRAAVRIPWDPHLDAGAVTDIDALRSATRDAYLRLAAAVADGFSQASARRADRT